MALLVTSLALKAALVASGMHRAPCFVGSSPSLRRSAPLLVQTWQPNEEHPNEVAVASLYELGGVSFVVACLGFVPASTLGTSASPSNPCGPDCGPGPKYSSSRA